MLTQKRLKELFIYDEDDGQLYAKGCPAHTPSGYMHHTRYRHCRVEGRIYLVHRLVWLYIYGKFPEEIDHINGVKHDNRICNLREVTHRENQCNQRKPSHNTSGCVGVTKTKYRTWRAQIHAKWKHISLGCFKNKSDAVKARESADMFYGFHKNHGT